MDIDKMTLTEVEERLAALDEEVKNMTEVEAVEQATEEKRQLLERQQELQDLEDRKEAAKALQAGKVKGNVFEKKEVRLMDENKKVYTVESPEYRDAFYAWLGGYETEEQRAIVVDTSAPGDGDAIAIPKTLDTKIWDGIHAAHPITADVQFVRSGMALEVTKHTAIGTRTTKKLDSAANAGDQNNTFVKVVLYGHDYEAYVELTYAEAKMSAGAMEDYLAEEISAELGDALAKDIFAQILTDATTAQKVTATTDMFADVKGALALATLATKPVIYAPATEYYSIVGAVNGTSTPFNIAATLGCEAKLDTAATKVTIVDPKMFVVNEVQSVMIESDRDIKNHKITVSGYMRAQGTLRKVKAAAYID